MFPLSPPKGWLKNSTLQILRIEVTIASHGLSVIAELLVLKLLLCMCVIFCSMHLEMCVARLLICALVHKCRRTGRRWRRLAVYWDLFTAKINRVFLTVSYLSDQSFSPIGGWPQWLFVVAERVACTLSSLHIICTSCVCCQNHVC